MGSNTQQSTVLLKQQNALSSFKQSVSILNYCLTTFPQAPYNLHSITAKNRQRERKYSYPARSPVCTEELLLYTPLVSPLSSGLSQMLPPHRHSVLGRTPSGSAAFTLSRCLCFLRAVPRQFCKGRTVLQATKNCR